MWRLRNHRCECINQVVVGARVRYGLVGLPIQILSSSSSSSSSLLPALLISSDERERESVVLHANPVRRSSSSGKGQGRTRLLQPRIGPRDTGSTAVTAGKNLFGAWSCGGKALISTRSHTTLLLNPFARSSTQVGLTANCLKISLFPPA